MAITNTQIAAVFNHIADILELEAANQFRVRAYRSAAMSVLSFGQELFDLYQNTHEVPKLPGLGKDLTAKVEEIIRTGTLSQLKQLETEMPAGLTELMTLPGLGAKRVRLIYDKLGVKSFDDLEQAARSEKIRTIRGLGEKTEQAILEQIARQKGIQENVPYHIAEQDALPLAEYLRSLPHVTEVVIAGSFRRCKETVRDLDFLAVCSNAAAVMEQFLAYHKVKRILGQGLKKSSAVLESGLQVDIRAVASSSYGAALVYFTGSKDHNIAIRKIGVRKKLKVNEYGVFRGKTKIAGSTEEEVYSHVGLPFIAPELREDRGEIKAAIEGSLPSLVESGDIKGDLHIHTMQSNGRSTLEDFAQAAARKGYEYIAITEHSAHNTLGKGLEPKAMLKCIEQIEKFNKTCRNITVFKGAEIDILEDGSLDCPKELLEALDIRLFAVHDHYNLSRQKQTARVLRAMQSPYFQILAHPTGRKIGERSACDIDMEKIIAAAAQRGCFLECNARPTRLDIGDLYLRRAKDNGVKVVISSDAHDTGELDNMRFGVYQARRGWIEKSDIINTLSLESVRSLLELKKPNRKQSV